MDQIVGQKHDFEKGNVGHPISRRNLAQGQDSLGDRVANVAFSKSCLAYDLVHRFKRSCLPPEYAAATVDTVARISGVASAVVSRAGHNVLQLPRDYHHREEFVAAFEKIEFGSRRKVDF